MEKNSFNNKLNLVDSFTDKNNALPHDNEAEEILLGALISDNNSIELIENGLSDFHFYIPMLGRIFKAVLELANKDQVANPLTLDHYFADDSSFKEIGGKNYLLSLCEGNLGSGIVKDYAELILELFNKRELIRIAQSIFLSSKKIDYEKSSSQLNEETEAQLYAISENKKF